MIVHKIVIKEGASFKVVIDSSIKDGVVMMHRSDNGSGTVESVILIARNALEIFQGRMKMNPDLLFASCNEDTFTNLDETIKGLIDV